MSVRCLSLNAYAACTASLDEQFFADVPIRTWIRILIPYPTFDLSGNILALIPSRIRLLPVRLRAATAWETFLLSALSSNCPQKRYRSAVPSPLLLPFLCKTRYF